MIKFIKGNLKSMVVSLVLSFVLCFMLFVYEPIAMFSSNSNDFWFDFSSLVLSNLLLFLVCFFGISIVSLLVYFISIKIKKQIIYNIYILIYFICFVYIYIQGNYLVGSLPTLDGAPIDWSKYGNQNIISILAGIFIIIVGVIIYKKFNKNYKKIIAYGCIFIFLMQFVSLGSILLTNKEMYIKKGNYVTTNDNINKLSNNKNFLMLLVDMADSKPFNAVLKDNNMENLFKDFTYFPDTLSAYPFTRESIPFILTGEWYEAQEPFNNFYSNSMTNSSFIKKLKDYDYDVNIYENELIWNNESSLEVSNIKIINQNINKVTLYKQELKYILFRYLPFPLKKYSKINTMDFYKCRESKNSKDNIEYSSDNKKVYDTLGDAKITNKNYFQFVHIDGGHYPWDTNKDFEHIENGTYEDKLESALNVIEKYLNRIKNSGQYDNSVIIILADHGNNGYNPVGRQNPILYIKGINEHHDTINISDKKVSYADLNDTIYTDLLNNKQSNELLNDITNNRVRRFIYYKDYDKMREQTLDGYAWETNKLKDTGKVYER